MSDRPPVFRRHRFRALAVVASAVVASAVVVLAAVPAAANAAPVEVPATDCGWHVTAIQLARSVAQVSDPRAHHPRHARAVRHHARHRAAVHLRSSG